MARALGLEPSTRCFGRIAVPCTTRVMAPGKERENAKAPVPFRGPGPPGASSVRRSARGGSGLAVGPTDLDVLAHDDCGGSRRSPGGRDVQFGLHGCKLLHPTTPRQELCSTFFALSIYAIVNTRPHSSPSSGARTRAFEGGRDHTKEWRTGIGPAIGGMAWV